MEVICYFFASAKICNNCISEYFDVYDNCNVINIF